MALLDRPLNDREIKEFLRTKWYMPISNEIFKLISEPRYQMVRYRAALNRIDYERPDTFYQLGPQTPSDCHWMIPEDSRSHGQLTGDVDADLRSK